MTEAHIEKLLQQMTLREPSSELDEFVTKRLSGTAAENRANGDSRRYGAWSLLSAVAIACLTIGLVTGYSVANSSALATESGKDSAPRESRGIVSSVPAAKASTEPSKQEVVIVNVDSLLEQLHGPDVAVLCVAKNPDNLHATKNEQCLTCHSGLAAAESQFRKLHVKNQNFATCMWCHDTNELGETLR